MSQYKFNKAELQSIDNILKELNTPLSNNFLEHTVKQQNALLFDHLRSMGYTGNHRVSNMLDFIYSYDEQQNTLAEFGALPIEETTQQSHTTRAAQRQLIREAFNEM